MKKLFIPLSFLLAFASGCRKSPNFEDLSYQFTVSTSLDKDADFTEFNSYFIADTVIYVGGVGQDTVLVGAEAAQLTQAVKDNLNARGYTFVARNANPDLGLIMTAIKDVNVVVDSYPGWWDGYYGGCYWYYYCYGYYYPWSTVYTYTTGTVILNMYNLKSAPADNNIRAIWNVTALGALGSTPATNIQLGVEALNQGFLQSPYVKAN